jgi:hypothetical protein
VFRKWGAINCSPLSHDQAPPASASAAASQPSLHQFLGAQAAVRVYVRLVMGDTATAAAAVAAAAAAAVATTTTTTTMQVVGSCAPRRGRLLLFPHACPHVGRPVQDAPKLLLRGEVFVPGWQQPVAAAE